MSITLTVRVANDGALWGGDYEQRGYVATWASWGNEERDARCIPLPANAADAVAVGPLALPPLDALRGDETVWVAQFAMTTKSGIPQIDAKESGHVPRAVPAGIISLPLAILLKAKPCEEMRAPLIDGIAQQAVFLEMQRLASGSGSAGVATQFDEATAKAKKGSIGVRVSGVAAGQASQYTSALKALMRASESSGGPLLYQMPRFVQQMVAVRDAVMMAHSRHFFASDAGGAPLWPINERERSLDSLHLFSYQSDMGWLPAAYYTVAARAPLESYTRESALFLEQQLAAALHRAGMTPDAFVQAIRTQHASTGAIVSDDYLRALAVVLDAGTFVGNTANYTSDQRYINAAARGPASPPLAAPLRLDTRKRRGICADFQHLQVRFGAPVERLAEGEDEHTKSPALDVEDFGVGLPAGTTSCDDCEGSDRMASHALEVMEDVLASPAGRLVASKGDVPLLAAAGEVLATRLMFDVGASVTSAYVDTEGKDMVPHKDMQDLPMIGDDVDARSHIGGHCHGVWVTRALAADWYAAGGANLAKELPDLARAQAEVPAWHRGRVGMALISEGTGSTDPFVLPTGEVFGAAGAARGAALRAALNTIREKAPTLVDTFKFDGLGYYDAPQPLERRISPFYRGVAFLMSARVLRMNPVYANCAMVNTTTGQRGVEMGTLLRSACSALAAPAGPGPGSAGAPSKLGLVSAYAKDEHFGRARWDREVTPLAECILNQMPRSVFARFIPVAAGVIPAGGGPAASTSTSTAPMRATFQEALARVNHTLSDSLIATLPQVAAPALLGAALDRHGMGQVARAGPAPGGPASASMVATLYTQPWRLADPAVNTKVQTELAALHTTGITLSHDFRCNRPLPQCVDTIELRLVLPPIGAGQQADK